MSSTVEGLPQLSAKLKQLPIDIARKVLRKGVSAGAQVIKNEAIKNAPVRSGTLRRAGIIKFITENSNDTQVEYIVTFRRGKAQRKSGRDAFYASWVEFGHRSRSHGLVPPQRFLGRAFTSARQRAVDVMISKIRSELAKMPEFQ